MTDFSTIGAARAAPLQGTTTAESRAPTTPAGDGAGVGRGAADRVSLSDAAQGLRGLVERLSSGPGVDAGRVAAARLSVTAGTYSFDSGNVASSLVQAEAEASSFVDRGIGSTPGVTSEINVERGQGSVEIKINREFTGPNGGTRVSSRSISFDAESQTLTRVRTATNGEGETFSFSGSITRTDSGFENGFTVTDRDGESFGRSVSQSYDEETGLFTRKVSLDGDAYDLVRTFEGVRTSEGFEFSRTQEIFQEGGEQADDDGGDDLKV